MEIWKQAGDYEKYEVSNYGRVRRIGKMDCLTINYNTTGGYGRVSLGAGGRGQRVHKLVALTFLGARPKGLQINHVDSNKKNNQVNNLEYVTGSENCKQTYRHGIRDLRRENHNRAKLSESSVKEIKKLIKKGVRNVDIARRFKVDASLISHIKGGRKWV